MPAPRLPPRLEALVDGGDSDDSRASPTPSSSSQEGGDGIADDWEALAAAAPPLPPIDAEVAAPALAPPAAVRAALATGERSPRVAAAAAALLTTVNPADYSAWQVRWECAAAAVAAGGGTPESEAAARRAELAFVDALVASGAAGRGPGGLKVYQVWRHRARLATERFGGGDGGTPTSNTAPIPPDAAALARERRFAEAALASDAKHYHAWAHRAFLASAAGPAAWWPAEADFAAGALADDGRNNSAWSHRAAAVRAAVAGGLVSATAAADSEFALAATAVRADPDCASAWAHARLAADLAGQAAALAGDPRYAALAVEVLTTSPGCVPALALLHEAHAARAGCGGGGPAAAASRAAAAECRRRLAAADPGRAGLWAALGEGV
jgi:hypothetical protein